MDENVENNILDTESLNTDVGQDLGDGTVDNPFKIADLETLIAIKNNLSACYCLTADIDLEGVELEPIGTSSAPFTGVFDGAGHTIRNLKMERGSTYTICNFK